MTFKTEKHCKVATGRWTCPYTGEVFTDPGKLDVDHMVPLGAAYAAGGYAWDAERRESFANELGVAYHLIAVKAAANRSKGKKGPEEWLPSNQRYRCEYVANWVLIKTRWQLAVSGSEKLALTNSGCSGRSGSTRSKPLPVPATSLPATKSSSCPTTAACGCSKLRKAECNTSCCKWTVGEGCNCR